MKREFIQQEDMQLLLEAATNHNQEPVMQHQPNKYESEEVATVEQPQPDRYPVIDPDRPFVCQKCGVSFAREKALLSHSRVSLECDYI